MRTPLLLRAGPLFALLLLADVAAAAPPVAAVRSGGSFTMLVTPAVAPAQAQTPSNGVGVAPSKPVVRNPYQVPLLQNAGGFGSMR